MPRCVECDLWVKHTSDNCCRRCFLIHQLAEVERLGEDLWALQHSGGVGAATIEQLMVAGLKTLEAILEAARNGTLLQVRRRQALLEQVTRISSRPDEERQWAPRLHAEWRSEINALPTSRKREEIWNAARMDIERAVEAQFPERAEAILRELEQHIRR